MATQSPCTSRRSAVQARANADSHREHSVDGPMLLLHADDAKLLDDLDVAK